MENVVHLFDRTERGTKAQVRQVPMTDLETLKQSINDDELYEKLLEDQEILQELISPLDMDRVMAGQQSPLFFGSAMTNFGVQLFLDKVRHVAGSSFANYFWFCPNDTLGLTK
jgi:peptide chain release factor 3